MLEVYQRLWEVSASSGKPLGMGYNYQNICFFFSNKTLRVFPKTLRV